MGEEIAYKIKLTREGKIPQLLTTDSAIFSPAKRVTIDNRTYLFQGKSCTENGSVVTWHYKECKEHDERLSYQNSDD